MMIAAKTKPAVCVMRSNSYGGAAADGLADSRATIADNAPFAQGHRPGQLPRKMMPAPAAMRA
ncbi:hypothetical protein BLTE_03730 [Blastochloris tepida]|uniref:Uncharacterized protein n=1 Tax=Blastochloris tepida TaxID=2233851 RepID=A0A348FWK5_9HYPH|nr:hypothetical protein BLTE_03730 [Blastochloris tepida]